MCYSWKFHIHFQMMEISVPQELFAFTEVARGERIGQVNRQNVCRCSKVNLTSPPFSFSLNTLILNFFSLQKIDRVYLGVIEIQKSVFIRGLQVNPRL